ncbi:MAG: YHS domain-containing protein [Moorea sp. SIO2B7]|nr:YHS domain-containing protein [Moorena sp. SIO2B7]
MKIKTFILLFGTSILSFSLLSGCANSANSKVNQVKDVVSREKKANSQPSSLKSANNSPNIAQATNSSVFYTENGIAIKGTDPVAYFRENKPIPGNSNFSYQWGNATWYFKNAENRDLFSSNPEKYAPQYGGFCAWAVSQGYTAPIDPEAWKIVNGKLYLNFNKRVQKQWERDIPGNIAKADQNWPGVLNR